MKRKLTSIIAIGGALVIAAAGLVSAAPGGGVNTPATEAKKPEPYDLNALDIETNATDGDAALVLDLDGEVWNKLKNTGLTGMTFDSAGPPFKRCLSRTSRSASRRARTSSAARRSRGRS